MTDLEEARRRVAEISRLFVLLDEERAHLALLLDQSCPWTTKGDRTVDIDAWTSLKQLAWMIGALKGSVEGAQKV